MSKSIIICIIMLLALPAKSKSEEALVAVATNFASVAKLIKTSFEFATGHRITIVSGSTGKLYAQVVNGAPFDVLLAADRERPVLLESSDKGVVGSRFTYAIGRLALESLDASRIRADLRATIAGVDFAALAIANPALAPYGAASREVLQSLKLWDRVREKIVMGENVGQAHAMVATGNAEVGIVALSLVRDQSKSTTFTYIEIPANLHDPIRQDALLLSHGENNVAARAFLDYLLGEQATMILTRHGYGSN